MPTFNGATIFGTCLKWNFAPNEVETQQNTYFGLSGVEELPGGQRGAFTTVHGWIWGETPANLKSWKKVWWSYYDGQPYTLVDPDGDEWPAVKLRTILFVGKPICDPNTGWSWQQYEARFFHQLIG